MSNRTTPTEPRSVSEIDPVLIEKAREYASSVVDGMCGTWRHDYGLLPKEQAEGLRKSMEQIAYHDVSRAVARALQDERDGGWQDIATCPELTPVQFLRWDITYVGWFNPYADVIDYPYQILDSDTSDGWNSLHVSSPPSHWAPIRAPRPPHSKDSEG